MGEGGRFTHDPVPSERAVLVAFEGAEHMIPVSPCSDLPWTAALPAPLEALLGTDPAWDRAQATALARHLATAFSRTELLSDPAARAALGEDEDGAFAGSPRRRPVLSPLEPDLLRCGKRAGVSARSLAST